jgi:2-amino-4-hydroxy-6-hydroxymethyldihydropteridine diphosphokinase
MSIAYIGLGSNIGNKSENILHALNLLNQNHDIKIIKISSFYETEPIGYEDQDWFINAVAELETYISPKRLLGILLGIEQEMGRKREIKWGPRIIDLDLLLYDKLCLNEPDLIIPHPRMHERAFVLVPLAEIAENAIHPIFNKSIKEILDRLDSVKAVKLSLEE